MSVLPKTQETIMTNMNTKPAIVNPAPRFSSQRSKSKSCPPIGSELLSIGETRGLRCRCYGSLKVETIILKCEKPNTKKRTVDISKQRAWVYTC